MSIWIGKTVNKEEEYVKLVEMVTIMMDNVMVRGVLIETTTGERLVRPASSFYQLYDRTEHVDFMEALYGQ